MIIAFRKYVTSHGLRFREDNVLNVKKTYVFEENKQCNAFKVEEERTTIKQPSNEWVSLDCFQILTNRTLLNIGELEFN